MAAIGRPSSFTPEVCERICSLLVTGHSLRKICQREDMPSLSATLQHLRKDDSFQAQYARARVHQTEALLDQIQAAADDVTEETAQSTRVKVWALQWIMGKMQPKKYGEKATEVNVTANVALLSAEQQKELSDRREAALERMRKALPAATEQLPDASRAHE